MRTFTFTSADLRKFIGDLFLMAAAGYVGYQIGQPTEAEALGFKPTTQYDGSHMLIEKQDVVWIKPSK